jgi:hypothetical protein
MKEFINDKGHPVHTRCITATTYSLGDDSILVEGVLKDDRLIEIFSVTTGEKMAPGVVHELVIRLLIKGPFFSIDDVDVEMRHIPRDDCLALRDALSPLIGHTIGPGFTRWVKEIFGGIKGCVHLNALLIAMAPAAVQGFWNHRVQQPLNIEEASRGMDPAFLIDTCWVWRSDGPVADEFLKSFNTLLKRDGASDDKT